MTDCFDISAEDKSTSNWSQKSAIKQNMQKQVIFSLYLRMCTVFNHTLYNQLYKNSNGSLHFYLIFNYIHCFQGEKEISCRIAYAHSKLIATKMQRFFDRQVVARHSDAFAEKSSVCAKPCCLRPVNGRLLIQ